MGKQTRQQPIKGDKKNTEETLKEAQSLLELVEPCFFFGDMPLDVALGTLCLAISYIKTLNDENYSDHIIDDYEEAPRYFPSIVPFDDDIKGLINRLIDFHKEVQGRDTTRDQRIAANV